MPGSPTALLRSPTGFCECRADASSRRAVRYSGCPDGQVSRTGGYRNRLRNHRRENDWFPAVFSRRSIAA